MSSIQLKQMAEFYNEARSRFLNSNIDLATQRDVVERLHLSGSEPEGVTYAEADANGVPSLWCIPEDCHKDHVLLHMHAGGSVVWSIHTDRKAVGHIAKAVGVRALLVGFPARARTQVPRTNRGRRESVSVASRTRDSSPEHRQHRSLHWRKPCCEPSRGGSARLSPPTIPHRRLNRGLIEPSCQIRRGVNHNDYQHH